MQCSGIRNPRLSELFPNGCHPEGVTNYQSSRSHSPDRHNAAIVLDLQIRVCHHADRRIPTILATLVPASASTPCFLSGSVPARDGCGAYTTLRFSSNPATIFSPCTAFSKKGAWVTAPFQPHSAGCNLLDEVERLLVLLEEPHISFETVSVRSAETTTARRCIALCSGAERNQSFGVSHSG
jgi:hypothetical protein